MKKDRLNIRGSEFSLTTFDPRRLTPNMGRVVVDALTPITAEGFMCPVSPALRLDVKNHVLDCDELSYLRDGKEVVAFTAVSRRSL